jgi:predicted membrane metal-binding protein
MVKVPYNLYKGVALRALRAFIAGFLATAASISLNNVSTWSELSSALATLALSAFIGGLTAALMAGDKAIRG